MYVLIAIAVIVVAVVLWAISAYNRLIRNRNLVQEGWSGIDVQLKRRANLIPNLLETVKGYMGHERGVLEDVTKARAQAQSAGEVGERAQAEGLLGAALGRLFAVAEAYPELKADANFRELQGQLAEIEDALQKARRYYNGAVRAMNTKVELFPSNIVAQQFRFPRAEYFEIEDPQNREVPMIDFGA